MRISITHGTLIARVAIRFVIKGLLVVPTECAVGAHYGMESCPRMRWALIAADIIIFGDGRQNRREFLCPVRLFQGVVALFVRIAPRSDSDFGELLRQSAKSHAGHRLRWLRCCARIGITLRAPRSASSSTAVHCSSALRRSSKQS